MLSQNFLPADILVHVGDLPQAVAETAKRTGCVAWDIETSGLNWKTDQIGTCQLYIPNMQLHIVQITDRRPLCLAGILGDGDIYKIFHHAMFDLRFMAYQWSVRPKNVACTKIASKILNPLAKDHSLKQLLDQYLHVSISKRLRKSNWLKEHLTVAQLNYAGNDVLYLPALFEKLKDELQSLKRWPLAGACYTFLPSRVQLDILGAEDVFQY